jgi:hypothetical protein
MSDQYVTLERYRYLLNYLAMLEARILELEVLTGANQ